MSRRTGRAVLVAAGLMLLGGVALPPAATADEAVRAAVEKHVRHLTAPELRGRAEWDDRKAAARYVAEAFLEAGLQPLPVRDASTGVEALYLDQGPAGSTEPPAEAWQKDERTARNVVAWFPPPSGDAESCEIVILSAHFDHLGPTGEGTGYFPGADDNASGVAALIEVARQITHTDWDEPPERGLVVVAFDLEEYGLIGSRRFAADPPFDLARCAAFLTMDQMGRSLADLVPGTLLLMGAEHSAGVRRTIAETAVPEGAELAILGIDFQPPTGYSDYVAFQERKIPFLFVTTGACRDYHKPSDTADGIDYDRLTDWVAFVEELVVGLLFQEERPTWRAEAPPEIEEIRQVHRIVVEAEKVLGEMEGVPTYVPPMIAAFRTNLEGLLAKGEVTRAERTSVRNAARLLFQQAVALSR